MATDHRSHSAPPIDLTHLSQFDLNFLSRSSSPAASHRSDDDSVIPKIDRSVFNESAGSRKQTFSRLRLAPRNKPPSVSASSFHIPLRIPEPVDEENSQIIALLQQLFGVESLRNAKLEANGAGDDGLLPVQVEFQHLLPQSMALAFQNIPIDVVQEDGGQRKRKRGRPRKNENLGFSMEEEPKKLHDSGGSDVEGVAARMVNEKGLVVDVVGLGEVGDPFGEEVKRRTQGLEAEEQLLAFLEGLKGDWGSQRKKRRIVQASVLGDLLPTGWKIVLTLKRRAGRASIVCSRYVRFSL